MGGSQNYAQLGPKSSRPPNFRPSGTHLSRCRARRPIAAARGQTAAVVQKDRSGPFDLLIPQLEHFNWSDSVQIDLSQVKHVDTSALSLIFEFKRNAKRNNQIVTINTPPKNLLKLAKLYGVEDLI